MDALVKNNKYYVHMYERKSLCDVNNFTEIKTQPKEIYCSFFGRQKNF